MKREVRGLARRSRIPLRRGLAGLALLATAGCGGAPGVEARHSDGDDAAAFVDVAEASGLEFRHFNGMSGEFYMVENVAPGAALFDFDDDGDLDVYLIQGKMLGPGKTMADATFPWDSQVPLTDRLFRNDLRPDGDGGYTPQFTDVTEESGIVARHYGMGVATGDFDGDGRVDLYVTNFGPNQLFLNLGGGRFRDASASSGTDDPLWSVSAEALDVDRDGRLDLFVGNYLNYTFELNKDCVGSTGAEDYCAPDSYAPLADRLYRNRGGAVFVDETAPSGVGEALGSALGVVAADFNHDGLLDVYVANDGRPNACWINRGNGRFENTALFAGCALNRDGMEEASMGVDAADFDGDGDEDLFMAHLDGETNTLYVNLGGGTFEDRSVQTGAGPPSRAFTGFGAGWRDFDHDGRLDLFVANGAVRVLEHQRAAGEPYPLRQQNQLFLQTADGAYRDASEEAGAAMRLSEVSRGAAFGDVDNDGDVDVLLAQSAGPARLLLNRMADGRAWIGLRMVGGDPPRDLLGTRVGVELADGRTLWRRVRTGGSYASASDPRVQIGLSDRAEVRRVVAHWPDGSREAWTGVEPGRYNELRYGSGVAVP